MVKYYIGIDGGSAYAIGRDLLHEVVMEWDGRKEKTILTKAVFAKIGITSIPEMIAYIYDKKHTKREIAMIASILTDGELLALESVQEILENGAKELVSCVKAVAAQLHVPEGEQIPLVLAGSNESEQADRPGMDYKFGNFFQQRFIQ